MGKLLTDRYELIEKIGEGGMAVVYKGKDRLLNRYVAIKILRPEYTKDNKFVESFIKESQSAAGLIHPNIVAVYDVGNEGNIHFIVMELVDGKPLSEVIKEKGKIEYKETIRIIKQIAQALSVAHKNQIIHRDIKPHNIIITTNGTAKLADFGIARALSQSNISEEKGDKVIGSVHYFSPEQARGAYVDERSDIYSLGIVMYEMLTGKVPFDGDNPLSIALMHINKPIPKITEQNPSIPPQLDRIVSKCTEKLQINRFRYVDELISELDDIEFVTKVIGNKDYENVENNPPQDQNEATKSRNKRKNSNRKSKKNEKIDGKIKIWIIAVIAIIAIGIIGLGILLGWFDNSKEFKLPNFVGLTYEQALLEASDYGLIIERGEDVYSPDREAGIIEAQLPQEGASVKEGKTVIVNVSKGIKNGIVPKLTGMTEDEAKAMLERYGFLLGTVTETHSNQTKGTVVSQSISAGDTADNGTKINVTISDGTAGELLEVPNLVGHIPQEADIILEIYGFQTDGKKTYEENDEIPGYIIFWQSIEPGTYVEYGTTIDIKIAKGSPEDEAIIKDFDADEFREEVIANLEWDFS